MMKFVTSDSTTDLPLRHGEQYDNCSEQLLIEPDTTPLAALDPAILSCGLPAIVLDDEDSMRMTVPCAAAIIRYTVAQLLAFRKSPFSHRRPAAIDDPQMVHYPIWRRSGFERSRRASSGDEEQYLLYGGGSGRKLNDRQRDNGFNPPRFRRNHEFSNRNHHVIVKSYSAGDGYGHNMRLQDTIIEEEPEWVSAGPTSRLDTIELRGFDEDLSRNVTESLKSSPPTGHAKRSGAFYDELLHYEHVHPKGQGAKGQHDTSGGADGESVVSTSNSGSPPPARSTPTKHVTTDMNNNNSAGRKGCSVSDGKGPGCSSSSAATGSSAGVNVSNFEEFMKFESMLGDLAEGNGSRFSKYFRRVGSAGGGGAGSGSTGGHNHSQNAHHLNQHQQQQHHVRFALDRNTHHYQHQHQPHRQAGSGRLPLSAMQHPPVGLERPTQQQPPQSYDSGSSSGASSSAAAVNAAAAAGDAKSFQRLLEMMAAQNQRMQQQQQQHYLLQLLQNSQQTEALRQVLMKKCSLEGGQQRVPTQAELQLHTQTIMKQALLRKKIAEQSRLILEQEPIPAVQQLIQSICPNVQRSLSVLGATSDQSQHQPQQQHGTSAAGCHFGPEGRNGNAPGANGSLYAGGNRAQSRSASSNRRY